MLASRCVCHTHTHTHTHGRIIYNNFSGTNPESKANRTGIQLLGIVVANKMPPYDPVTAGSIDEQK